MKAIYQSKPGLFSLGVVVGILSFAGVLSIGEGGKIGNYATAHPVAVIATEKAAITSGPSYPKTSIQIGETGTDSSLNNYQLERDACCPGSETR